MISRRGRQLRRGQDLTFLKALAADHAGRMRGTYHVSPCGCLTDGNTLHAGQQCTSLSLCNSGHESSLCIVGASPERISPRGLAEALAPQARDGSAYNTMP